MSQHTFDADDADKLEEAEKRYRRLSAEELLWALAPAPDHTITDLGSGTGFYTDDVAPHADTVYAVDVQQAMHDYYGDKGMPANVEPVTTSIEKLPFADDSIDGAFSTMTYHEFVSDDALAEVQRVLAPSGRLAVADWSAAGTGEHGPPLDERYTVESLREHGFAIEHAFTRTETFLVGAAVE
jgi:ubiquinone/menaquinone biosynthesis C-methylase UbiE